MQKRHEKWINIFCLKDEFFIVLGHFKPKHMVYFMKINYNVNDKRLFREKLMDFKRDICQNFLQNAINLSSDFFLNKKIRTTKLNEMVNGDNIYELNISILNIKTR